jgi:glycosyltransferase involved in cell wall biosynthesis
MTFHGTWAKSQERLVPQMMTVYYAEKIAAQRCDIAVACSTAVKNELIDLYGIERKKIMVIHNGVGVDKFVPINKAEARKRLNLPLDHRFVLWVGAAPQRKGLFTLMKAVKSLTNVTLLVAGFKGTNVSNTHFLGRVSEADLIAAYSAADLLVFPTVYEGFPVVPMEALSCVLPIVVSKESNMGEVITEGVHGFTIQQNIPEMYREKIQYLLNNDGLLSQMSLECRKLALKYSWSIQAQKYLDLYKKMLG